MLKFLKYAKLSRMFLRVGSYVRACTFFILFFSIIPHIVTNGD